MKKLVVPAALALVFGACSDSNEKKERQVPSFNGLEKINPKFNEETLKKLSEFVKEQEQKLEKKETIDQSEQSGADEKNPVMDKAVKKEKRQLDADSIRALNSELKELKAEIIALEEVVVSRQLTLDEALSEQSSKKSNLNNQKLLDGRIQDIESLASRITEAETRLQKAIEAKESWNNIYVEAEKAYEEKNKAYNDFPWYQKIYEDWITDYAEELQILKDQKEAANLNLAQTVLNLKHAEERLRIANVANKANKRAISKLKIEIANTNAESRDKTKEIELLTEEVRNTNEALVLKQNRIQEIEADLKVQDVEPVAVKKENQVDNKMSTFQILKLQIIQKIQKGERPSVLELVDAMIAQNLETEGSSEQFNLKTFKDELVAIAKESASVNPHEYKVNYENKIAEKFHSGDDLIYNKDFYYVQNPITENRVQCYSGTNLFASLNELSETPQKNMVFIYTAGHVLPGYIISDGKNLKLVGIETTAGGKAQVNYGVTNNIAGSIQVFDAHQVMLMEVLRAEVSNNSDVMKEMIETMKIYDFNYDEMHNSSETNSVTASSGNGTGGGAPASLNASMFGFGSSDQEAGDIPRQKIDTIEDIRFQNVKPTQGSEKNPYEEGRGEYPEEEEFLHDIDCERHYLALTGGLKPLHFADDVKSLANTRCSDQPGESFMDFLGKMGLQIWDRQYGLQSYIQYKVDGKSDYILGEQSTYSAEETTGSGPECRLAKDALRFEIEGSSRSNPYGSISFILDGENLMAFYDLLKNQRLGSFNTYIEGSSSGFIFESVEGNCNVVSIKSLEAGNLGFAIKCSGEYEGKKIEYQAISSCGVD